MVRAITLEEVLSLADQLSLKDKVRLIELLLLRIQQQLHAVTSKPVRPLRGVWRGLGITEEDIARIRQEMWGDFPRQDI